jgi:alcohol dehydrogenase
VEAVPLVSYLRDFVRGVLAGYRPPLGAFTPGTNAIGVIEEAGPGVYGLVPGQRVLVSGYLAAAENGPEPAEMLLGLTAGPGSGPLQEYWKDGTLAEQVIVPAASLTPVPPALDAVAPERLAAGIRCLVPYGGFLRGRLAPGEIAAVNGATGAYGRAAVQVALAMGAARVVAAGRNTGVLDQLSRLDRVRTVRLTGDRAADAGTLRSAADGQVQCALDMIGQARSADSTLATLDALSRGGRLVLMGSMAVPLPVDYTALMQTGREILGAFMYPRDAPARLLALAASGRLDLGAIEIAARPLGELPSAMDEAAAPGAPLIVLTSGRPARPD